MSAEGSNPFSPNWFRVSSLKPRLRQHVEIHRHVYRNQPWYILQDKVADRQHRFSPSANVLISLMDGERDVQYLWDSACDILGDDAPTQDQVIELLGRLHDADLLISDSRPDSEQAERRQLKVERSKRSKYAKSPLSIRVPLGNPDRWLDRLHLLVKLCFNRTAGLIWFAAIASALAIGASYFDALQLHASERAMSPQNLLVIALAFPLMKILHELAHGLAVKRWSGAVPEFGLMFLIFAPVPYVDASGAAAFADKYKRIVVSLAGIATELLIAAIALHLWVQVQPGLVRDIALDVALLAVLSTLLFNGNPLLRFDAYFALADWLEIPNLAQRAQRHLGYLILHHAFRVKSFPSPATAPGETSWFVIYAIAAGAYKLLLAVTIISYVAGQFFIIGILLAILASVQMLLLPTLKHIRFLIYNPILERRRKFALGLTGFALALLGCIFFVLPAPLTSNAEGVVWLPDDAKVRAHASGFVHKTHVRTGQQVRRGQLLFEVKDPLRDAQIGLLKSQIEVLEIRKAVESFRDRVKADILEQQLKSVRAELALELDKQAQLAVRSPSDGELVLSGNILWTGRYIEKGEQMGIVLDRGSLNVRAVVGQGDIKLIREDLHGIEIRFADETQSRYAAKLVREVPAANYLLPSRVLGSQGGGKIAIESGDPRGLKTTEKVFQIELALVSDARESKPVSNLEAGQRVFVRFDHRFEPLAWQSMRRIQQTFLRGFGLGV